MVAAVNNGTRTKEEERLKEGMCNQVEECHAREAKTKCRRHVAELRQRRIGEDFLDIILPVGAEAGVNCNRSTQPCN